MIRKKLLHQEIKMPTSKHDNATLSLWILAALFFDQVEGGRIQYTEKKNENPDPHKKEDKEY